ncbi:MAG: UvrD-helicase domain-containing protein [Patescibacteria group bacterium]|nr:UvrD-helicase domain-containing protein [Patescibacteria group bacterium]
MTHLDALNARQLEAALHTEGPLLIIAGAGAGKTKTITSRIIHLIVEKGVPPRQILAVTFTNKAADEMRERVRSLVPAGRSLPLIATFHAFGVRVLREFHKEAGLPRAFSIWDRDDSARAIKRAQDGLDDESMTPRQILSAISHAKSRSLSPEEYEESARSARAKSITRIWRVYESSLASEGALDFDDILLRTHSLLRAQAAVREKLQKRFSHITIDEYQDTNAVQYEIISFLSGEKKNVCVVGDGDQNIYSWRGADLEYLLDFERAYPGTKIVTLEQNYRSTRTILSAANGIIEKNVRRKPKNLFTENETGEAIEMYGARNEMDEAWFVATTIQTLIGSGVRANKIAVLYRENFQSRVLEEALLHFGIPYRVLGTKFFERKEVKDVLSYVRAARNPLSRLDIARAAGAPPRGIGKVTLEKMFSGAALSGAAAKKVAHFRESLSKISSAIDTFPASEAVRAAIEISGIERMYPQGEASPSGEAGERLENIRELVNLATRYDYEQPPQGIEKLLEEAALQSDQDELPAADSQEADAVSLMTVHASKGLEFDAIFVTGLEQGLFPSLREGAPSSDAVRDPEEERRLFYVALTRARKRLFLSYADERMRYGTREHTIPSEFLSDLDPRLVRHANPGSDYGENIIT